MADLVLDIYTEVLASVWISYLLFILLVWPKKGEVIKSPRFLLFFILRGLLSSLCFANNELANLAGWIINLALTDYLLALCLKWNQLNFWRGLLCVYSPVFIIIRLLFL